MRPIRSLLLAAALAACGLAGSASGSDGSRPPDARTAAWWRTTSDLASDAMEGRDTGSAAYDRAAAYVAKRFRAAGLKPAGEAGGWLQPVAFDDVEVTTEGTALSLAYDDGTTRPLRFLHEVSVTPFFNMGLGGGVEELAGRLTFRGYCRDADMADITDAVVVCLGTRRPGQPSGSQQVEAAKRGMAAGVIRVDDPGFLEEPARWPLAYARTVAFAPALPQRGDIPVLRLSAEAFPALARASGQDAGAVLAAGGRGEVMPSFDLKARIEARFAVRRRSYSSPNVLAVLPGTEPALASQPVLVIAHLDGYGYGTPVNGDGLYNGALDDAAYVATLITLADARKGKGFRRPVVFAAVTGEEKGLLGSRWLADHPTPGAPKPVAVLNLDQLRPLYPLKILTTIGLEDSTLGDDARAIAAGMGVEVRTDREPDRGLIRRTDHWPFWQKGVPGISFLFGFDASDATAKGRYLDWYRNRYHAPQDDMGTPIDFQAQADFHRFWFALVERVANAGQPPRWKPQPEGGERP